MKFKCDIPIVTYDTVTVVFDTESVELNVPQKTLIELMKNSRNANGAVTRQFTDFELAEVMQLLTSDVPEFYDSIDDRLYGSYQTADNPVDYNLTVESFEVIE